jgi:hypothetical protein
VHSDGGSIGLPSGGWVYEYHEPNVITLEWPQAMDVTLPPPLNVLFNVRVNGVTIGLEDAYWKDAYTCIYECGSSDGSSCTVQALSEGMFRTASGQPVPAFGPIGLTKILFK